ncbi:hypothetical protein [Saccharicrinis aurantiacus]|uniref:hypothetical protein n=1 Tax=Saccharicrinis aurantiacus TaxID=1849719 RepID=UPI002490A1D4|nr:hypothetical protein [Saccharicrinis aurantiacus]
MDMNIDSLFKEANKIWPFRSFAKYMGGFAIIFLVVILIALFANSNKLNSEFYEFEIHGEISEVVLGRKHNYVKINSEWFAIQGEFNAYLKANLKIDKDMYSTVIIINDNGNSEKLDVPKTKFVPIDSDSDLRNDLNKLNKTYP